MTGSPLDGLRKRDIAFMIGLVVTAPIWWPISMIKERLTKKTKGEGSNDE